MEETHSNRKYKDTTDGDLPVIKGICTICRTGQKLCKGAAITASGREGGGTVYRERDTGRSG